jgi:hypothetical protein
MIQHGKSLAPAVHDICGSLESLLLGTSGRLLSVISENSKEATLKITSTQPDRAPIEITLDEDFGAYLKVGRGSIFEIPFEGNRYTKYDFVEELAALVGGIINSGFEEDVVTSKDKVIGASGIIRRSGNLTQDAHESWRRISWDLFSKRERTHHTYFPY